jgi:hypothetical protein
MYLFIVNARESSESDRAFRSVPRRKRPAIPWWKEPTVRGCCCATCGKYEWPLLSTFFVLIAQKRKVVVFESSAELSFGQQRFFLPEIFALWRIRLMS